MKIGVDFDDVVIDCNTSLALFHNARYGTTYQRNDVTSWFLEQVWGCSREEAVTRAKEWYYSPEHAQTMPIAGAVEAIEEILKHHELHIITSRPAQVEEHTRSLIEQHFPGKFSSLTFTSYFEPGSGSKVDVCKTLGISLMIEDSLLHARAIAAAGIPVLLLDTPWNQENISVGIVRIYTWEEILEYVISQELAR